MRKTAFAFILIFGFSVLGWIHVVKAIQCHDCSYEAEDNDKDDKDCESKPGKKYLVECSARNSISEGAIAIAASSGGNESLRHSVEELKAMTPNQAGNVFGCAKIVADGNEVQNNRKIRWVIRSCVASPAKIESSCKENTVAQWKTSSSTDHWSQLVSRVVAAELTDNSKVDACYCSDDKCNSAPPSTLTLGSCSGVLFLTIATTFLTI